MRRKKSSIRRLRYFNIVLSVSSGLVLIALLIMLFSYAGSKCDMPEWLISAMVSLSVAAGGFASGFIYGKRRRHKGLVGGAICGIIIYAVIIIFGIIYLRGFPPLRIVRFLITLCISGAVGGVAGVNSKLRRPPV